MSFDNKAIGSPTALLDPQTSDEARKVLREQGSLSVSVKGDGKRRPGKASIGTKKTLRRSRVSRVDLLTVTSQLSIMCRSGIDLAESLQNIGEQCEKPVLKTALEEVFSDVSDGEAVSAAMSKQPHVFDNTYVASVSAGEASGQLPEVLSRLALLLQKEIKLRSTIRTALSYPVVLTFVSGLVLFALIFFVLPQFAKVFKEMDVPAPVLTQILLDLSTSLRTRWWLWGGLSIAALTGLFRLRSTEAARRYWDGVLLNGAIIRNTIRSLYVGRSFRLIGTMLQSGVPLLESIQMCRSVINNCHYRSMFDRLEEEVMNGKGIGSTLLETNFVPIGAAQMVSTAERTGRLGNVMETVGEFYEDDGERRLLELTKYLEPAIIVCMGVLVAGIVLSIMLPMFDFSNASH